MTTTSVKLLNKLEFPDLIYGTRIKSQKMARPSVSLAFGCGYRGLDSASLSSHDELSDGRALNALISEPTGESNTLRRQDILVQSKFSPWNMHQSEIPFQEDDEICLQIYKSLARTAENLAVECLDVYFLHRPFPTFAQTMVAWRALEQIAGAGASRYLGVSQADLRNLTHVYNSATVKPSVLQNRLTKRNHYDRAVRHFCSSAGLVYEVYGVFSNENMDLLQLATVVELAGVQGWTREMAVVALLLAGAKAEGLKMCILDGTSSEKHMRENLLAAGAKDVVDPNMLDQFVRSMNFLAEELAVSSTRME